MAVAERDIGRRPASRRAPRTPAEWPRVVRAAHARGAAGALLGLALLGALIDPPALAVQLVIVAMAVALLGLPHGAIDGLGGAAVFARRTGRGWAGFVAFYLALAALVVAAWIVVPVAMLAAFLALAVWHFGSGDAEAAGAARGALPGAEVVARGALPIVLPVALHPQETGTIFAWLADTPGLVATTEAATTPLLVVWGVAVLAAVAGRVQRGASLGGPHLAEFAALVAVFALWPPLLAFAAYFALVHAPRHMLKIDPGPPGGSFLRTIARLTRLGLPLTAVTLAGAALGFWVLSAGDTPLTAGLKTLFWGLSALTVPHMLLDSLEERSGDR